MADPAPPTFPDLLRPGLRLVFVGINPGLFSAQRGHYFARTTNRFWPAFSQSRLSRPIRTALDLDRLTPEHDRILPDFGIGFTDVAKRPTANASGLLPDEFVEGACLLAERLAAVHPAVVCFHGLTGFRPVAQHALGLSPKELRLGPQAMTLAGAQVFVVPNPSSANAHFTLADQTAWYDALAGFLDGLPSPTAE